MRSIVNNTNLQCAGQSQQRRETLVCVRDVVASHQASTLQRRDEIYNGLYNHGIVYKQNNL